MGLHVAQAIGLFQESQAAPRCLIRSQLPMPHWRGRGQIEAITLALLLAREAYALTGTFEHGIRARHSVNLGELAHTSGVLLEAFDLGR
jgi:hypothetical protein